MNEQDIITLEKILDKYDKTILIQQGKTSFILHLIYNETDYFELPEKYIKPLDNDIIKSGLHKKYKYKILPINEKFVLDKIIKL